MQCPHDSIKEKQFFLKLLELINLSEETILQNGEHEVSMLICDSLASSSHHKLPETRDCLRLMATEQVAQINKDLCEVRSKLSVAHLDFFEECFADLREGILADVVSCQTRKVYDQGRLDIC